MLPKTEALLDLQSLISNDGRVPAESVLPSFWTGADCVRLIPELDMLRAGQPRWQWLTSVLKSQGYVCERVKSARGYGETDLLIRHSALANHLRWILRIPTVDDQPACLDLFEKVFNEKASKSLWQWKYANGRGRSIIAIRGDHVIAHYGGVSRRVYRNGQIEKAIQITDVMVDPAERAVMTRSGAFLQMARASQEYFLGYEAEHDFGFGFPNQRHMLLAHRLGLYDEVERLVEMEWSGQPTALSSLTRAELIDPRSIDPRRVDDLWHRMRAGLGDRILVVRDAGYWFYRYSENPS
ncbi:MAG: hypothetical protein RLZZ09_2250, partial [Pseudomonadota bacterium]